MASARLLPLRGLLALLIVAGASPATLGAEEPAPPPPPVHLARFGAGTGPRAIEGGFALLDEARTPGQSNAVAFDRASAGTFRSTRFTARLGVDAGGDGGAIAFLATARHGAAGPAPFLASAVEPNLGASFAVGIDVHNPKSEEMFTRWGNYEGRPEREVSLHVDGREVVKRVAPEELRGREVDLEILLEHVVGGAEATVRVAGTAVYERFFLAHLDPYELRLALFAGTRADAATRFDVRTIGFEQREPARPPRPPLHVEVFDHVRTDNRVTAHERVLELPPAAWAFGRVVLTLDLHDAGEAWDEWDRNGEISVFGEAGQKLGIVPFITSYRTPCHWKVDVTRFRSLLSGKRRLEIAAGTTFYKGRGYLMSVALDYHHGTPALEPFRVTPLWLGTAHYRSHANHFQDFFEPRQVTLDPSTTSAEVWMTTTGHSQVGEFTPARRALTVTDAQGGSLRAENLLWKSDCYLNPNRPQAGTWQFARAGWAPGDVVHPWVEPVPLDAFKSRDLTFAYEARPYEAAEGRPVPREDEAAHASHEVRAYLVEQRPPTGLVPAPTLRIGDVVAEGAAAKAGIQAGDYLASYDGVTLDTLEALRGTMAAAQAAGKGEVRLVVYRGSERIELGVAPGKLGITLVGR